MARAMWKGAIQFGLVTIPVKLYLATESKGISFNMLHKTDLSRIQMKVWCPVEDEPVISRGDTVKGYEYAPGEYVVITDEDLENVPLKTVRSIEIEQFTKAERDDAAVRFVKSAYYLEPDKIGRKAFYLLQVRARGGGPHGDLQGRDQGSRGARRARPVRRHDAPDDAPLARRDPVDGGARPAGEESTSSSRPSCTMAEQLVSAMTGEFDPAQYKDEYREALEPSSRPRSRATRSRRRSRAEESGNLVDLMAARGERQGGHGREDGRLAGARLGRRREEGTRVAAREGQGRGQRGGQIGGVEVDDPQDGREGRRRRRGRRRAAGTAAQDRLILGAGRPIRRDRR